ncbi:alpha-amylase family glycosyl hydrolase [Actinomyces sp. W5033]|uniref:alpha-amylase family glycosyl hydrolase n=1 Tax=Actinomyces sp. W5033 TaxID=3446479 RepID=UPI003EE1C4F7
MTHVTALDESTWADAAWPLGTHLDEDGAVTVAVCAPAATRLQVEVYPQALGADAVASFAAARGEDGVWRARLAGLGPGSLIGLRAWGPNWPYDEAWVPGSDAGFLADLDADGNRFNPNKLLFDPYSREVTHTLFTDRLADLGVDGGVFGTGGDDVDGVPRRLIDTGRYAPKGVVIAQSDDRPQAGPGTGGRPDRPGLRAEQTVIYEAGVDQLTGHPSAARLTELLAGEPGFEGVVDIPAEYQGTYKGVGMLAPYLKAAGVTTLELLPVHETNASESGRAGATNSWGYMTLAFFAPSRRYAADRSWGGPTREFREMVDAFHAAGLEVYLDVVYNHTAEGGNWNGDAATTGFTSLGGLATAEYYQMTSDKMLVDGATGTANQLNYSSETARTLVLDSLRYWSDQMGVDGFRFDLATVLGRLPEEAEPDDWGSLRRFFTDHPLLVAIADLARERGIKVIAEAWDLWGYEVGNFPRGWGEWNGRYRDAVRRFTKGDGNTASFIDVVNGDYHHFQDNDGPQRSVNFVVAHDGFNMADLVSYQEKNNGEDWPFGPSDGGSDDNLSWDSGGSQVLRRQRLRNLWAVLMLSRGVPMVVAGDEMGRTQNGNNNPWALESVAMRNNYAMIRSSRPQGVSVVEGEDWAYHDNLGELASPSATVNPLFRFATALMRMRQRHPALQQARWGGVEPGGDDVSYLFRRPDGESSPQEGDRAVSLVIDAPDDHFAVLVNMDDEPVEFALPTAREGLVWRRLVDTAAWAEPECNIWDEGTGKVLAGPQVVHGWSVMVAHGDPAGPQLLASPPAGRLAATGRGA